MWSDCLVFCDCCFQTVFPLMKKNKRLMETYSWERLTEGKTGSCSDGQGHASVQFSCSVVSDSLRPHEPQHTRPPCLSPTSGVYRNSCPLSQWCHPTISSSVISFSSLLQYSIRIFSNESVLCIRWPEYWSFSISPSNDQSGLISFRTDWLDLLAVQGALKSLLQHHGPTASIFQCSAFFIFQLSHPYMTTGKTIALTRQTYVGKVMSLLFNMLSRLVITFLPKSKCLLIHGYSHHLQGFWNSRK